MTFEGYAIAYTQRAVLFHGHYWNCPQWFPLSQVDLFKPDEESPEYVMKASAWISGQKGLREFTEVECPEPEDEQ